MEQDYYTGILRDAQDLTLANTCQIWRTRNRISRRGRDNLILEIEDLVFQHTRLCKLNMWQDAEILKAFVDLPIVKAPSLKNWIYSAAGFFQKPCC